ncbi:hypothetical protein [Lichenicola sp.]|uniref:hypothetical protein n=1 Tax=Lichenicola sp. TaxID=2804529 RepID=UPI003B0032F4
MTSFLSTLLARLDEPSTYAGLSALALTVAGALALTGPARYTALATALIGGAIAIAKSESKPAIAEALDRVLPLLPLVVPVLEPRIEAALKPVHIQVVATAG